MQTEPPNADPAKRKRRWFQYSLRSLLIGVALLAIPCGYLCWQAKIVRERKAWLSEQLESGPRETCPAAWRRGEGDSLPFVRRLLGDCELVELWIRSEKDLTTAVALFPEAKLTFDAVDPMIPSTAEKLRGLMQLQSISLAHIWVSDPGLANLKGMTRLQKLSLVGSRVNDADLMNLKELTKLQELSLFATDVTDAGVADLQRALPNCKIEH